MGPVICFHRSKKKSPVNKTYINNYIEEAHLCQIESSYILILEMNSHYNELKGLKVVLTWWQNIFSHGKLIGWIEKVYCLHTNYFFFLCLDGIFKMFFILKIEIKCYKVTDWIDQTQCLVKTGFSCHLYLFLSVLCNSEYFKDWSTLKTKKK